ncbi:hypothetical protein ACFQ5D_09470 [Paenibacillus farraposensis]|uniref:Uncharacterized protein n=1 Tax=Paenibacillus farraposensis TaxID=2807095 RepID=A0ABW4DA99_9BACL|nr:hypothetical protein [Paenibacillus farraposensis]MCC3379852.1 hypothetical protein [Paenibacillus farraposensis]
MGTSVPNWKNELSSQGQGDVKTYTLSPEELEKIVGKPIPKSHTKPLSFRAKTKTIKEEIPVAKVKDDPKPVAPIAETAAENPPITQPDDALSKPVLSKAEDEAIKWLLTEWDKQSLLHEHAASPNGWQIGTQAEALNGMSIWLLAQALISGYAVKLTPAEKMLEAFESKYGYDRTDYSGTMPEVRAFQAGMITALEIAGLRFKGVNRI